MPLELGHLQANGRQHSRVCARATPDMGEIVTFYSYKGGTGRTMALANIAWLLACNGYRVLAIDWDLEAPGLHRFFKPFLIEEPVQPGRFENRFFKPFLIDPEMFETDGLIDALWTFTTQRLTPALSDPSGTDGFPDDVDEHQIA